MPPEFSSIPKVAGPSPLLEGTALVCFHEEILQLSGAGRVSFLNSYNTQDILAMSTPGLAYGAILTQKGKIVSDTFILALPERILLLVRPGFSQKILEHLKTFLLFADAELTEVTSAWAQLGIFGPGAADAMPQEWGIQAQPGLLKQVEWEGQSLWVFFSERLGIPGFEILGPRAIGERLAEAFRGKNCPEVSPDALEPFRIDAGIPRMGVDMGEDNLVAEVGLDKRATSFNKGCYLGQETTARVNSQGHVNRNLAQWRLTQPYSGPLPAEIHSGEKIVGQLTSVASSPRSGEAVGLGVVHRLAWEGDAGIFITGPEGKIALEKFDE